MRASAFEEIMRRLDAGEQARLPIEAQGEHYTRCFIPEDRLILLGGGHVSLALAQMAVMLDFSVTVADDRPVFANSERFRMADRVICDSFVNTIKGLQIRSADYVCVLTRGHRWDKECVEAILSGSEMPYYLGMIGSKRRSAGLREALLQEGYDPDRIARLHAPIGLPIGGVTPAEIALSVCAEMVQLRRQKPLTFGGDVLAQMNTDPAVLRYLAASDEPRAMLLVLSSDGSTPVKSGAMMAVSAIGTGYGTIGGGCSEAAAIAQARRVIGTGGRRIIDVDMSNEVAADNGMVCGGQMRVLIEDIIE